jgi:hypothetical protein
VPEKIRIAFVKFGGLAAAGTERWLQMMAAHLSRERFAVDYYYCDAAPYIGSEFRHPDTDPDRRAYMERAGVNLIKFKVGAKDITKPTHDWVDTDFWDVFDPEMYDFVQTGKAGHAEYPYDRMPVPVVEFVTLSAGVDRSKNLAFSIHVSQWQRRRWARAGGRLSRSDVIPIPAEPPAAETDLRDELGIPSEALVAGFHQRVQDEIFSPIPLRAFEQVSRPDRYFLIMGGSALYREQAAELGLQNAIFLEHSGAAERISRFLNTLDVFAHGRRDGETGATVFGEAMMHGRPCMSHWSPIANAQPETMGPAGLFAGDDVDYAEKLERLFSDRELRERLAGKARRHARRYYSLESCVARLEHVYQRLTDDSDRAIEHAIPYGQSDFGFLIAGAIDDPASTAHHVVTGRPPQAPLVDLLARLLRAGPTYREVGSPETILALAAAHHAPSSARQFLYVSERADLAGVAASIDLNNWENRLSIRSVPSPMELPIHDLCASDVLTINSPDWASQLIPRLELRDCADRPVLLLNLANRAAAQLMENLEAVGYRCERAWRGWFVCLHPLHHGSLQDEFKAWAIQRKRLRRRRRLTLPARAARTGLAMVRALANRFRQSWPF